MRLFSGYKNRIREYEKTNSNGALMSVKETQKWSARRQNENINGM